MSIFITLLRPEETNVIYHLGFRYAKRWGLEASAKLVLYRTHLSRDIGFINSFKRDCGNEATWQERGTYVARYVIHHTEDCVKSRIVSKCNYIQSVLSPTALAICELLAIVYNIGVRNNKYVRGFIFYYD